MKNSIRKLDWKSQTYHHIEPRPRPPCLCLFSSVVPTVHITATRIATKKLVKSIFVQMIYCWKIIFKIKKQCSDENSLSWKGNHALQCFMKNFTFSRNKCKISENFPEIKPNDRWPFVIYIACAITESAATVHIHVKWYTYSWLNGLVVPSLIVHLAFSVLLICSFTCNFHTELFIRRSFETNVIVTQSNSNWSQVWVDIHT